VGVAALILGAGCSGRTKVVETVSAVAEARIGVMTGSIGDTIARNRFPKATIQTFDDVMDAVTAIKSGQLEAVVLAFPTGFQITKRNADLVVLGEPLDIEETAVALRKDDTDLLGEVNRVIAGLRQDGTLEAMHRRWFKPHLGPYEVPPILLPTNGTPLRVGVSATREPLTFVDEKGEVSGHDGELARRIGQALGRPVEFSNMKFLALIPALQSRKIDLIVTGMNASEERRKSVAFSDPYFANAQVMLVRKAEGTRQQVMKAFPELGHPPDSGKPTEPPLESLDGRPIGVLSGSAGDLAARKRFTKSRFDALLSAVDAALALQARKIDALVYDQSVLENLVVRNPNLLILAEPVAKLEIAGALRKDNTALIREVDRVMADLEHEQVFQQLRSRWVDSKYTVVPETPPAPDTGAAGVLRVGTSPDMEPYSFVANGRVVGLDIELAGILARRLERRLEIVAMNFEGLIPALQSGKIDLALSNFNVTEERKKLIAYSRPYIVTTIGALVRREGGAPLSAPTADGDTGHPVAGVAWPPERKPFLTRVRESFHNNVLLERRYLLLWDGLKTTVIISLGAALFGTLLGALVCWMRMAGNGLLAGLAKAYIALLRGTPVLVVLMITFYVVFASVAIEPMLVAVLAFGLNFAAYAAEIFRSGIEGIDRGQSEAGIAMGFTRFQTFRFILLPQTLQRILPVYKGECISLVKMTSIVGYIAVQDLTKASDIIRSRTFDAFFPLVMVAILYFLIAWALTHLLGRLERRAGRRRKPWQEART